MVGTGRKMSRLLSVLALVAVAASGCASAAGPQPQAERGLPHALAQAWATRASEVASAAAAGQSCRASQLASSLRDEIMAEEGKVPARLQKPLLQGANSLAHRITCTPPPTTVAAPTTAPKPPDHKPPKPHEHDHKHGDEHGDHG
jgi:hypothetical protein